MTYVFHTAASVESNQKVKNPESNLHHEVYDEESKQQTKGTLDYSINKIDNMKGKSMHCIKEIKNMFICTGWILLAITKQKEIFIALSWWKCAT